MLQLILNCKYYTHNLTFVSVYKILMKSVHELVIEIVSVFQKFERSDALHSFLCYVLFRLM